MGEVVDAVDDGTRGDIVARDRHPGGEIARVARGEGQDLGAVGRRREGERGLILDAEAGAGGGGQGEVLRAADGHGERTDRRDEAHRGVGRGVIEDHIEAVGVVGRRRAEVLPILRASGRGGVPIANAEAGPHHGGVGLDEQVDALVDGVILDRQEVFRARSDGVKDTRTGEGGGKAAAEGSTRGAVIDERIRTDLEAGKRRDVDRREGAVELERLQRGRDVDRRNADHVVRRAGRGVEAEVQRTTIDGQAGKRERAGAGAARGARLEVTRIEDDLRADAAGARERAARDGDRAGARGGTTDADAGIRSLEGATVDRGTADIGVGVGQGQGARARLDEGDVGLDLAMISRVGGGAIADREGDGVRRAVDNEAAGHAGDGRVVRRERAHRLSEAVEVEDAVDGRRESASRREDVRRADAQRTLEHMGAARMRARAGEDDGVVTLLGELAGAAEAAKDLQDDATGGQIQGAQDGSHTTRVEAVVTCRDVLADERIAEQLEGDARAEGAVNQAGVAVEIVVAAQPTFDAAAVEPHDDVIRRVNAIGDELVRVDLQGARTEFDGLTLTGAVRAPALDGVGVIGERRIGHRPAGLVDVQGAVAIDRDWTGTEGAVGVHLDGAVLDSHRTGEGRAFAPDRERGITPFQEAGGQRTRVIKGGDGKAVGRARALVEAFEATTHEGPIGIDDRGAAREGERAGHHHRAPVGSFDAEVSRHEAGSIRRVDADCADADGAIVATGIDVDAGLVLHVDRAEGVVRREHRGRARIQTQHRGRLRATVLAGDVPNLVHILGAPDGDITRAGGTELTEIQATLVEAPVRREAVARAARGSGLVFVQVRETRAEHDDASGGEVTVDAGGHALMDVDSRFRRTGRAELEVGVDRAVPLHDEATADDGGGIVLAGAAGDIAIRTQGIDDWIILQRHGGRDVDLVGGGGQAGRERARGNCHVRSRGDRGEANGPRGRVV